MNAGDILPNGPENVAVSASLTPGGAGISASGLSLVCRGRRLLDIRDVRVYNGCVSSEQAGPTRPQIAKQVQVQPLTGTGKAIHGARREQEPLKTISIPWDAGDQ